MSKFAPLTNDIDFLREAKACGYTEVSAMHRPSLRKSLYRLFTGRPLAAVSEEEEELSADDKKRAQRKLGRGIMSVRELVERYNISEAGDRELLLPWLYDFIEYIGEGESGRLRGGRFLEYAELANIQIHSEKEKDFLQSLVESLSRRIKDDSGFLTEHLSDALHDVLMRVDPNAFENCGIQLRQLVDNLIEALKQQGDIPDHFLAMHRTPIHAIHQALFLLKRTPGYKLTKKIQVELFQSIEYCENMGIDSEFYPYHYQCRLVKQGILRLRVKTEKPPWVQRLHAFLHGCWAAMHCLHGLKAALCDFDVDPDAFQDAVTKWKEANAKLNMLKKEPWYDTLQKLHESIVESPMDADDVESAEKDLENALENPLKGLLFGVLRELSIAVLSDHRISDQESSKLASTCFETLSATLDMISANICQQDFKNDLSFLEPVVNALCEICVRSSAHGEKAWSGLQRFVSNPEFHSRNLLPDWAEGDALETRIKELSKNLEDSRRNSLFYEVRSNLAWSVRDKDLNKVKNVLKNAYTRSDFGSVNQHLSRNRTANNVVVFLQMQSTSSHSRKLKMEDLRFAFATRGAVHSGKPNILPEDESRRSWWRQEMPKRIELGVTDILTENRIPGLTTIESGKPRKVLLTGRPCTGKSTLGRAIAYNWAIGSIGNLFDMVYVLDLKKIHCGDSSHYASSSRLSLEQATATSLQPEFGTHFKDTLEMVIDHDLDLDTTLLIIDVSTTGEAVDEWIQQAMQRSCNLLVLRDPITVRRHVEEFHVELELIGLTDKQMIAYIAQYFGEHEQTARGLRYFLERCPDVWRMAHHPLALEMLCHTWDDSAKMGQDCTSTIPRSFLYSDMIDHITIKRPDDFGRSRDVRERFLNDLKSAVFLHLLKNSPAVNGVGSDGVDFPSNAAKEIATSLLQPRDMDDILKFRAYFCGKHITSTLMGNNRKEREQVDAFLKDRMYESTCMTAMCIAAEEIAKHLSSLCISANETAAHTPTTMELLLSFVEEKEAETIGLQPLLLKLTLIESFLSADEDRKRSEKNSVSPVTQSFIEKESVSSVIHSFIASLEKRAKEDSPLWKVLLRQLEQMPLVREAFPKIDEAFKMRLKTGSSSCLKSAARLFRGMSPFTIELVEELKEDYETGSSRRRQQLILCISYILTRSPDAGSELMPLIKQSLDNFDDLDVRAVVLEQLDVFISASPEDKHELITHLRGALFASESKVAKAAGGQISKYIQLFSDEQRTSVLKVMKERSKSESHLMRTVVVGQIGCVFEAIPNEKTSLIALLQQGLEDKEEEVRMAALEQIPHFKSNELQKDGDDHPLRKAVFRKETQNAQICDAAVGAFRQSCTE